MNTINGIIFRDMIISGAGSLKTHIQEVNDLNVFPVPDGDTGTNMSMTISAAASELAGSDEVNAGKVAKSAASALLRGARGNSGVITSLLFRGISKGFDGAEEIDAKAFAAAYTKGVESAYKAVMKPTEGTILTVARLSAAAGVQQAEKSDDIVELFSVILDAARETLEQTREMLPVLKQAGVVDSGGKGLVRILEGMYSVVKDGVIIECGDVGEVREKADFASFELSDIKFAYCTEFLVNKNELSLGKDFEKLHQFAMKNGDSVVFVDDEEIVKIHVHTNHPGKVLEEALKYGYLSKMKIENMKEQLEREQAESAAAEPVQEVAQDKEYGFVAVAAGEGMSDMFTEMGIDNVVFGGQTMNPSADDILKAIEAVPAKKVFVFPNNKNIIMAAQLAVPMSTREVIVVPTRSVPECVSAMFVFDESMGTAENLEAMQEAASAVTTGQVTYAVRDSSIGDTEIKEGQIMGLSGGLVKALGDDVDETAYSLAKTLADEKGGSVMTVYSGEEVTSERAQALVDRLTAAYPSMDVALVEGKQPVYFYIVSVE